MKSPLKNTEPKEFNYKGFIIIKTGDEYWVHNPNYRMYKIPKFKTIKKAKSWINKK